MKTLAKYHACNRRKKHPKIYLSHPVSYREFRETGPRFGTSENPAALKIGP